VTRSAVRRLVPLLCAVAIAGLAIGAVAARGSAGRSGVATAPGAAATPVVSGNRLIDTRTGTAWVPRGVNYPSFEYACAQGWGTSRATAQGAAGAATAAAIAGWHANAVRLPLNQDCWNSTNGVPAGDAGATYQAAVQAFVGQLNAAGLVVILDLHSRRTGGPQIAGQRAMPDAQSVTFWSSVAHAFAGDPSVLFDAFNEPYSRWNDSTDSWTFQLTWSCWRDGGCRPPVEDDYTSALSGTTYAAAGMASIVGAIRGAGAGQPILLGGLDYANDLRSWLAFKPADGQLVASLHSYDGQRCSATACWNSEVAALAAQVPVVIGEFGADSSSATAVSTYDEGLMSWADAHGIGYLAWAWWVLPDTSTYALLGNDDGTPRAPAGTAVHDHLAALAAAPATTPPPTPTTVTRTVTTTATATGSGGAQYFPVAPCRLVDTRVAGGALANGTQRAVRIGGATGFAAQGGTAAGCGIPTDARAIAVTLVSVSPAGTGFLLAFPTGGAVPAASTLNYNKGLISSSGATLTVTPGRVDALTIRNAGVPVQVVLDVLGYYR
jgi:hypothetical protein